jgi:pimeloyl-ACP methyl ester carboxylesterase
LKKGTQNGKLEIGVKGNIHITEYGYWLVRWMISKIEYESIIPENANLPTLVFIHGGGGDKKQWHYQLEYFKAKGFGLLALSLPGHGKSVHSPNNSISNYAKDVYLLISHLNLRNFVLIGHSMGGGICLSYVLEFPDLHPARLILIGTGAKLNVAPVFFELLSSDFNQALSLMGKFSYATETNVDIKQRNQDILVKNGPEILIQDLKACQQFDVRNRLAEITIPSLIICGEEDNMTPIKFSEFLHQKLKNSKFVRVPNAGHFVFQEASNETNNHILEFLHRGIE